MGFVFEASGAVISRQNEIDPTNKYLFIQGN
jgi:hypothetical protein